MTYFSTNLSFLCTGITASEGTKLGKCHVLYSQTVLFLNNSMLITLRCLLIASTIFSVLVGACIWWVLILATGISIFYIEFIQDS